MDLRSESNLDKRLENVLLHHNAVRKGLNKKIYEKDDLKKAFKNSGKYFKICATCLA